MSFGAHSFQLTCPKCQLRGPIQKSETITGPLECFNCDNTPLERQPVHILDQLFEQYISKL
ncbi:hypothetical protein ADP71_26830 [Vitreoscilla sp. C1]|nr:hypothetical protein ADP71_26830 [Vitreoscilla sp. C1]